MRIVIRSRRYYESERCQPSRANPTVEVPLATPVALTNHHAQDHGKDELEVVQHHRQHEQVAHHVVSEEHQGLVAVHQRPANITTTLSSEPTLILHVSHYYKVC